MGDHEDRILYVLKLALCYLEHPDVQAIPFAMGSALVAERPRMPCARATSSPWPAP